MKKKSLLMSALASLVAAAVMAGCGSTYYFAGRTLPPSGIRNRVLIAIQHPSSLVAGSLQFVDAYYDIRHSYDDKTASFSISGFSGSLPETIQNLPVEEEGAVYDEGDGTLVLVNYAKETSSGSLSAVTASSIFMTSNGSYVFIASQTSNVAEVIERTTGTSYSLSLPGVYRVSVNTGGTVALFFVQNSNNVYYPQKLSSAQTSEYAGGPSNWPSNAVDCEPQESPGYCLYQAPATDASGSAIYDHPVKAVFSSDGGTAYVLNCGLECGGSSSSLTALSIAPMLIGVGQASGSLAATPTHIDVPGGASNALVSGTTLYVAGQSWNTNYSLFQGNLSVVSTSSNPATVSTAVSIADGTPYKMLLADDDTLWVGSVKCTNGVRYSESQGTSSIPYGCLTMFNTSSNTVTKVDTYNGDVMGLAAVTGYHKLYYTEGGQVYIRSTVDGSSINNYNVTVTGTATDVAYMDALTDTNNTTY